MINMNHRIKLFLIFLLCFWVPFISCTEEIIEQIYVTSVTLNSTSMELVEGTSQTLVATVSPSNADNQKVIWSSSNSSVATVNGGVVTAIKAGTATITVKTDEGAKTATCSVTVFAKEIPVTIVSLDQTTVELTEGDEFTLTAIVKPDNATNKDVSWSSSNESVASVVDGRVTALKAGSAIITVRTVDGGKTASCSVVIKAKKIPVQSVSLNRTSLELTEGDEVSLVASVNPDNATDKSVTWSSSNESVARVTDGRVTALRAGSAIITVRTVDGGKTASCSVVIKAKKIPVQSVSLNRTSLELTEGDEVSLVASVNPDNATDKSVTWSSSNESVARVADGRVTALKAGSAIITVRTVDGGKTASCSVSVSGKEYPVEGISLDKTYIEIKVGSEISLEATVYPSYATNKNLIWSSSDESIAKVSNGIIKALNPGTAIIKVMAEDGNVSASCTVKVLSDSPIGGNENVGENEGSW